MATRGDVDSKNWPLKIPIFVGSFSSVVSGDSLDKAWQPTESSLTAAYWQLGDSWRWHQWWYWCWSGLFPSGLFYFAMFLFARIILGKTQIFARISEQTDVELWIERENLGNPTIDPGSQRLNPHFPPDQSIGSVLHAFALEIHLNLFSLSRSPLFLLKILSLALESGF